MRFRHTTRIVPYGRENLYPILGPLELVFELTSVDTACPWSEWYHPGWRVEGRVIGLKLGRFVLRFARRRKLTCPCSACAPVGSQGVA